MEKATHLAVSLKGPALTVLSNIPRDNLYNYSLLIAAFEARFGSTHQAELHQIKLKNRTRNSLAAILHRCCQSCPTFSSLSLWSTFYCEDRSCCTEVAAQLSKPRRANFTLDSKIAGILLPNSGPLWTKTTMLMNWPDAHALLTTTNIATIKSPRKEWPLQLNIHSMWRED